MARERRVGTSAFTHEDDANAPIHTTHSAHQEAHVFGGDVPPKHELTDIVLGPPPFGSPDPRTLGHRMVPLEDPPASAPPLDKEFVKLQQSRAQAGYLTEEQLQDKNKDELLAIAKDLGVTDVHKSNSKQEIIDAIFANEDESASEQQTEEESTGYQSMSKDELYNLTQERNLEDVNSRSSKDDLIAALEESDTSNASA